MKLCFKSFASDTSGLVSVDWIGIAAAATVSASSLIAHVQDMVAEPTDTINAAIEMAVDQAPSNPYSTLQSHDTAD